MKLRDLINEGILDNQGLTKDQKKKFVEAVNGFNKFNEAIYRTADLKEVCQEIAEIGKVAETYIMSESEDWFDTVSIKRDMKGLQESIKLFEKTAQEVSVLQQRLESCYEEVGGKLGKYFEIMDKQDDKNITEKKNEKK